MAALADSVTDGEPFSCEYRLQHGDGSWHTVSDQGILLTNRSGRATNMIGAMRDVTRERAAQAAQREADELRRVLFRPAESRQCRSTPRGAYVDADAHALEFFGARARRCLPPRSPTTSPEVAQPIREGAARRGGQPQARGAMPGERRAQAHVAADHPNAHRRQARLLPARRRHHRAEGDAVRAGPLGARPAAAGHHPRRAQHSAEGAPRAA